MTKTIKMSAVLIIRVYTFSFAYRFFLLSLCLFVDDLYGVRMQR